MSGRETSRTEKRLKSYRTAPCRVKKPPHVGLTSRRRRIVFKFKKRRCRGCERGGTGLSGFYLRVPTGFLALGGPFPALVPLGSPTAYRNLYIHVPQSIIALFMAATAATAAAFYLRKPSAGRFALMDKSATLTAVFSWLSLATSTVWAAETWGSAWSGDPRQLAVGVMAVLYTAYIILKRSIEDPDWAGWLRHIS